MEEFLEIGARDIKGSKWCKSFSSVGWGSFIEDCIFTYYVASLNLGY